MENSIDIFGEIRTITDEFMSETRNLTKANLSANESYRLLSPFKLSDKDEVYIVGFEIDEEDEDGDLYVYCERLSHRMETLEIEDGMMTFELDVYELAKLIARLQCGEYEKTITYNN